MHAMMLRASGDYELKAVLDESVDSGVKFGKEISDLVDATIKGQWDVLEELKLEYVDRMGKQPLVDTLTVASCFNGITRVADASGIPVDPVPAEATSDMRSELGIDQFHYDVKSTLYS